MTQDSANRLVGGRFRLTREMGRGGTGTVWQARDERLDRVVAIKQLTSPPGVVGEARTRRIERVWHEAKLAARLDHPRIVRVHDVVEWDGMPASVMEYVDGRSLTDLLRESGPLSLAKVVRLGSALVDALQHAHAAGMVHRDLKPDNILLSGERIVVTDFGIALPLEDTMPRTATSAIIGTPAYMSPEQIEGKEATPASDLWSLAVILYVALEQALPFDGESIGQVLVSVATQPMRSPSKAGPLVPLLEALLTKQPDRRATAESVSEQLASIDRLIRSAEPAELIIEADAEIGRLRREKAEAEARERVLREQHARELQRLRSQQPGSASAGETTVFENPAASTPPAHPPWRRALLIALPCVLVAGAAAAALLSGASYGKPSSATTRPAAAATKTPRPPILVTTLTDPDTIYMNQVESMSFAANGTTLAVSGGDGKAYVWNTVTEKVTDTLSIPYVGTPDSVSVALTSSAAYLATCENGSIYVNGYYDDVGNTSLWNTGTRQITGTVTDPDGRGNYVTAVGFAPHGTTLATGDNDDSAYLRNTATGNITATYTDPDKDFGSSVDFVAFAPNGTTLATGDHSGNTYLWNTTTGKLTATFADPAEGRVDDMTSVAFAPDSTTVATGDEYESSAYGNEGNAYLWDATTGKLTATLTDPGGTGVDSVAFAPDGTTLAVGDLDGHAYLWNTKTAKVMATLTDPGGLDVTSVAFASNGILATGDDNGNVYLWRLPG